MDVGYIIQQVAIAALPVLLAITFHEAAHGFVAFRLGDPTAKLLGRLTLNPLAHVDLFGTVLLPAMLFLGPYFVTGQTGLLFGYAKPVPVNFLNLRRPKQDMIWVAAAGPGTNLILALLSGLLLRVILTLEPDLHLFRMQMDGLVQGGGMTQYVLYPITKMLEFSVIINVILMVFNLLPVPPLDGGRVMVGLLPDRQANALSAVEPYGFLIILFFLFLDPFRILYRIIHPIMMFFMGLILGGVGF